MGGRFYEFFAGAGMARAGLGKTWKTRQPTSHHAKRPVGLIHHVSSRSWHIDGRGHPSVFL